MSTGGPRFLDENAPSRPKPKAAPLGDADPSVSLPRGPHLLDPEPDAPSALHTEWEPPTLAPARVGIGNTVWILAGIAAIAASLIVFPCVSIVLAMVDRSRLLGGLAILGIGAGVGMVGYGLASEWRGYRRLRKVESLRDDLTRYGRPVEVARTAALTWVQLVAANIPDAEAVELALRHATTQAAVNSILRNRVAAPLREAAMSIGRRAAVDTSAVIAISPHATWDGMIAGLRGLAVIRQVARLYGLRTGPAVTLILLRDVAWTAASTTGVALLSQGLADHAFKAVPIVGKITEIGSDVSVVAFRLYRLAGVTAQACCPVVS